MRRRQATLGCDLVVVCSLPIEAFGAGFFVLDRGHHVDRKRAQDELRTSSWSLVLDEKAAFRLILLIKVIKEHFLDLFLSNPGRYTAVTVVTGRGPRGPRPSVFVF